MSCICRSSTLAIAIVLTSLTVTDAQSHLRTIYRLPPGAQGFKNAPNIERSLAMAADGLAKDISEAFSNISVPDGQKYRVAVFKIGDDTWKIPLEFANPPAFMQGSISNALQTSLASQSQKFSVLLPDQLDQVLSTGTSDPQGLSGANLTLARTLMAQFNLQVCIFGRFLLSGNGDPVTIKLVLVTATTQIEFEAKVDRADLNIVDNKPDNPLIGRFNVSFQVKPEENTDAANNASWIDMKLKRQNTPTTENLFFLVVKPEWKGKRYRILISNKGAPPVGTSANDADRVFGAIVFVDGVSHVFKNRETDPNKPPQYAPQTGHPLDMPKEVLTKPGRFLKESAMADGDRFSGAEIQDGNFDQDKRLIVGFQKGLDLAAAFRFGEPTNAAAAELVGPISKLGTIQVFFYPEVFSDDGYFVEAAQTFSTIGTIAGEDVPSKRFLMKVKQWFTLPAETWNIVYRYEGDTTLPASPPLVDYP